MTTPQLAPAVDAPSAAAAVSALRSHGLRVSSARRVVLEALFAAARPLTAEELAEGGDGSLPSDVASVYRNLETLEVHGLVRHIHLGHGAGRYVLAGAGQDFVVCERCGDFERVAPAVLHAVRQAVRDAVGYEARFSHFPLAGLCPACRHDHDEPPGERHEHVRAG
jgi:Fur family transcriptional regulator, ferric uptake regulator